MAARKEEPASPRERRMLDRAERPCRSCRAADRALLATEYGGDVILWMAKIRFAPPKKPWNDESPL